MTKKSNQKEFGKLNNIKIIDIQELITPDEREYRKVYLENGTTEVHTEEFLKENIK